jgi:hypothetical protein
MKYFLLISCAVVMGCNNDSTSTTSKDSTSTASSPIVKTNTADSMVTPSCYAHQTSNNLVLLKLNTVRPNVSGYLTYAIMGKDKNEGIISGTMRGDTLFAHYNFMSEGKQSVRQVAFLKKGDSFVEGYGDSQQKGDSMIFSNRDTLNFNGTMILNEVPCKN